MSALAASVVGRRILRLEQGYRQDPETNLPMEGIVVKITQKLGMSVAAAALVGSSVFAMPVSAQGRSAGCTQEAVGGNTTPGRGPVSQAVGQNSQPQNSQQTLVNVITAYVSNVAALNNVNALNEDLNGLAANLQVVCLNDALNQNDVRFLNNVLSGNDVLNNSLNNTLNGNQVLTNVLQNAQILTNARIVSVDLLSGNIYLLTQ
jgi:hypothetical protein